MSIKSHSELQVYQKAFQIALDVFEVSRRFPKAEQYALTDQVRRSSRSVCANTAESWRKRRYPAAFAAKLSDAESEAAETQVWLSFALAHGYIDEVEHNALEVRIEEVLRMLVAMIASKEKWCF